MTLFASDGPINIEPAVVPVIDDDRDEVNNEGFLAVLELQSAMYPDLVTFDDDTRVTLARVTDNDGTYVCWIFVRS